MPNTFISYRRDDAAGYAGRLHEALEERLGTDQIFRDIDTLQPGQDFVRAIEDRLRECRVALVMIGREWLDARDSAGRRRLEQPHDFVRLEIAGALARRDVQVVPVLIEEAVMPPSDALPEDIRALARRHAVRLRDDAWDHDVERLAVVIRDASGRTQDAVPDLPAAAVSPLRVRPRWITLAGVGLLIAVLVWLNAGRDGADDRVGGLDPSTASDSRASAAAPDGSPAARGPAYGIPIPRVAEVAHTALLYTLLSGTVIPRENETSELRLRFRFSNEGRYDANAWDASFRLLAGAETLAPTGGLNEIVPGHSLRQGIVTFTIPARTAGATLRVLEGDRVAEIPLDLSPTGRPVEDERADVGDALSRAIVRSVLDEPRVLVRADAFTLTMVRATSRRFANAVRIRFSMRFRNDGPYAAHSGAATVRVAVGDQVLAPIESPNLVLEPQSTASADVEFELPPSAPRAVIRATTEGSSGEWAFDVP